MSLDYQSIFNSAPGLYLILDAELNIIAINDAYLNATMTKREEIVGRGLFDVFPDNPDDLTADGVSNLRASLNSVLKNKKRHTMSVQKYDIRRPDGSFEVRYWNPQNAPVLDEHNQIVCIIHNVQDVTEFIEMKNEQIITEKRSQGLAQKVSEMEIEIIKGSKKIQKFNEELETKIHERTEALIRNELELIDRNSKLILQNNELEQFTYIASHDLQEPLRTLISVSDLITKEYQGKLDAQADTYLNFIRQSSTRMQDLVKGLMDYSRIGKEKELEEVDCNQVLRDTIADMQTIIDECDAEIQSTRLPVITAYKLEIRQLFQNLISNAIKFRNKNKRPFISISYLEENNEWRFSINDNGIGIEQKDQDKIFTIFKRLHNRSDYPGTGIGLSHCKKITGLHGGSIWVDSDPGAGSTFHFTISKSLKK